MKDRISMFGSRPFSSQNEEGIRIGTAHQLKANRVLGTKKQVSNP